MQRRHLRASHDQAIDAVGDFPIFYFVKRRMLHTPGKKSRPAERIAIKVSRIVDNDWPRRNAPPLDRKVFAFGSGSTWPGSASPCPSFSVFCARLISSIFLSSAATIGWLFKSSAVSCMSLGLLISAFFKIFVSIYRSRLIVTHSTGGRMLRTPSPLCGGVTRAV